MVYMMVCIQMRSLPDTWPLCDVSDVKQYMESFRHLVLEESRAQVKRALEDLAGQPCWKLASIEPVSGEIRPLIIVHAC